MRHRIVSVFVWLVFTCVASVVPAQAQSSISAANNRAALAFPESAAFSVDLTSDSTITQVTLEYGVERLTCGQVTSSAIPQFTPAKTVTAQWTWNLKQTGSLPPGAQVWWRWRAATADGKQFAADRQKVTWLDSVHPWQTLKGERVTMHWYGGDLNYATGLRDSADKSLANLSALTGLEPSDAPPDLYIYPTFPELREAVLYAPSWTGGQAFYAYNIVIIGIPLNQTEWGKGAIAHELTHVIDLRKYFACAGNRPTWISEGLAVFGEGGPTLTEAGQFNTARDQDKLISVRALASSFPEDRERVNVSYAESYSIVNFLITEYGKPKFLALLRTIQDGTAIDGALRATYGFDSDGLEDAWRASIGAKPRAVALQAAAVTTPSVIPTVAPVAGFQFPTRTPTITPVPPTQVAAVAPTAAAAAVPDPVPAPITINVNIPDWIIWSFAIGAVILLVAVIFIVRQKRSQP